MKNLFFSVLLCLVASFGANARIVYVKAGATGANTGNSWANAFTKMDSAFSLTQFRNNDTIWVANGNYKPATTYGWICHTDSCNIYGGFAGTETTLSQRNWGNFQTVLDGDLGIPNYRNDNASGLIYFKGDSVKTDSPKYCLRLDGFKLINVYGQVSPAGIPMSAVSVLNNRSSGTVAGQYTISNCLFRNNTSYFGGAIYTVGFGLTRISNCIFEQNQSHSYGGAIRTTSYLYYGILVLQGLQIEDCAFRGNTAQYGGAIAKWYNPIFQGDYADSISVLDITRCSFIGDSAMVAGGAIYDNAQAHVRIYNSLFAGNTAPKGAVWYSPPRDTVAHVSTQPHTLYHCTIAHNRSTSTDTTDYPVTLN
ncbi:MAG: hypothetical protein JST27_00140, partial [Bacteroidetes bacterium]|nr:hypothetical protein [Bacteroidota bacterium]